LNKWYKRYLKIAAEVAQWSKDPSTKVGAIIVGTKGQIIANGFNGFPRGIKDSEIRLNDRPLKYKYTIHAEANAIYNAIHNGASTVGSSIFVSGLPVCSECAKAIIQCGIIEVCSDSVATERWEESCSHAFSMFAEVGIKSSTLELKD